jgi:hypothetical protein
MRNYWTTDKISLAVTLAAMAMAGVGAWSRQDAKLDSVMLQVTKNEERNDVRISAVELQLPPIKSDVAGIKAILDYMRESQREILNAVQEIRKAQQEDRRK